ncbi:MAG: SDR family NAD(P)-dependent oxidoreductase [Ruminococcaceae bacterium]|nr:SDR family NAD(P)-dependent oxidoreductase [Oscillospiraceae bacterium]
MENTKRYILSQVEQKKLSQAEAYAMLKELAAAGSRKKREIAVIGMACVLPEANNYNEFWENLKAGRDCLGYMPEEYETYYAPTENEGFCAAIGTKVANVRELRVKSRSGYIKDTDKFDAAFFGISPREAEYIDPSHRIFLQTAWSALEDAGYGLDRVRDSMTGVFVGRDHNSSNFYKLMTKSDNMSTLGSWHSILASRLSYAFNLRGPAVVIDTACSSGLTAVHEACLALRNGDCRQAVAGGIAFGGGNSPDDDEDKQGDALSAVGSSDATVRAFDKKSSGTVFGEGCVAFVLKRLDHALEDGDFIHAVIKGSAANNDGASNGITAPNPAAQEEVILHAWENAGVDPEDISYVEAHGTGTLLGDPIEFNALNKAFRKHTNKRQFCGLGTAKGNVGHLVAASGCTGMLKVIMAMKHRTLPASIHFEEPNQYINFIDSALYMVDETKPWIPKKDKLLADVSAFGFSGTNIHVVLEEMPVQPMLPAEEKLRILSLSARTEWSLTELLERYDSFLSKSGELDLDALCYTANTGRGNFSYRAAIVFKNRVQLQDRLRRLARKGLQNSDGVFAGHFKIVSNKRLDREEGDITESQIREINERADTLMHKYLNGDETVVSELLSCYVKGANIDWNRMQPSAKKMPLPTYPFEKKLYWAPIKTFDFGTSQEKYEMPLLESCLVKSMRQDIYAVNFSVKKHWLLREHVIMGKNTVPGTGYVELGAEIASLYYDGMVEFRDLTFMEPLRVEPDATLPVQIIVDKHPDHLSFTVVSPNEDENSEQEWHTYAQGKIYPHEEQAPSAIDLTEKDDKSIYIDRDVQLVTLEEKDALMNFGPRWWNMKKVYVSKGPKSFAHIKMADEFADDFKTFRFHTSMLDGAINAGISASREGIYLPFLFKSLKFFRPLPAEMYSMAVKTSAEVGEEETMTYDLWLTDKDGNVVATVKDYFVKKVHRLNGYTEYPYYTMQWYAAPAAEENAGKLGRTLLVTEDGAYAEQLHKALADRIGNVVKLQPSKLHGEEDYLNAVRAAREKLGAFDTILCCNTIDMNSSDASVTQFRSMYEQSVGGLFLLSKALMKLGVKDSIRFLLVTRNAAAITGAESNIQPLNGAYLGLGRCIEQEFANLKIKSVDVDEHTELSLLVNELCGEDLRSDIAYRGGICYETRLTKHTNNSENYKMTDLDQGALLITGGLGGLGLVMAERFASLGVKQICLISRKELPERAQWEQILALGTNKKLCDILDSIERIEAAGAKVLVRSADVCDEKAMEAIVNEMIADYGSITGLIHCAGVAGDGFIINKSYDTFRNVTLPKTLGTKILDSLLGEMDLRVCVLFSSMTSLMGSAGQSDYTAANAYLDAYAARRKLLNRQITALNWPAWKETGMAVDYQIDDSFVTFASLTNDAAWEYLNDAISQQIFGVVPGNVNLGALQRVMDTHPVRLSEGVRKSLERFKRKQSNTQQDQGSVSVENVTILGKGAEEYTATEKAVAMIYAGVLRLKEIDIYESFNSQGGDSMLSTEALNVLNREFGNILDVSDMFTYTTAAEMAEYIDSKVAPTQKAADTGVEGILEKLEAGDIELDKMLDYFEEASEEN